MMPETISTLRERFERDDPTLTEDEITELRIITSPNNWQKLWEDRIARLAKSSGELISIRAGRTEAQIAAEYRERMLKVLGSVIDIINEARQDHGMTIGFQIGAPDGFNRQSLALLEVSKKLC